MKKWLIISAGFNIAIIASAIYLTFTWSDYLKPIVSKFVQQHYQQKATMFEALPIREGSIIFLGNSIIEGANWEELFSNPNIINRGIAGDVTAGVLQRMDEIMRHQPSKLFIAIGTNDVGNKIPITQIMDNYLAIIGRIRTLSPNTSIYVQSLLPVAIESGSVYGHNNEGILAVNQELERICNNLDIPYIDLYPYFTDESGNLKDSFNNDGLHLLGPGYLLWKELISAYVEDENPD